ncbi:hypothetical protein EXIGLDRAFT_236814 [Exidia glandulosa HHB12029]|uniref:Uncharacterized protein n=1 Tax=Exidia glandulosa HHB12029 TaxID=1314781 RepID=A0A165E115_EXIGL|nr:hypothetical protein EXIGLDRAFT_236814 [Exidia glandulosa HHB12029]
MHTETPIFAHGRLSSWLQSGPEACQKPGLARRACIHAVLGTARTKKRRQRVRIAPWHSRRKKRRSAANVRGRAYRYRRLTNVRTYILVVKRGQRVCCARAG